MTIHVRATGGFEDLIGPSPTLESLEAWRRGQHGDAPRGSVLERLVGAGEVAVEHGSIRARLRWCAPATVRHELVIAGLVEITIADRTIEVLVCHRGQSRALIAPADADVRGNIERALLDALDNSGAADDPDESSCVEAAALLMQWLPRSMLAEEPESSLGTVACELVLAALCQVNDELATRALVIELDESLFPRTPGDCWWLMPVVRLGDRAQQLQIGSVGEDALREPAPDDARRVKAVVALDRWRARFVAATNRIEHTELMPHDLPWWPDPIALCVQTLRGSKLRP